MAKQILGIKICRDRKNRKITLSGHLKLTKEVCPKTQEEEDKMSKVSHASVVGSLMYVMVSTRPNIAHAVGVVSRYMSHPSIEHWNAVKWILRYLRGTSSKCLHFRGSTTDLQGYVDSDLAWDIDTRWSTIGYVFTIGGAAVS